MFFKLKVAKMVPKETIVVARGKMSSQLCFSNRKCHICEALLSNNLNKINQISNTYSHSNSVNIIALPLCLASPSKKLDPSLNLFEARLQGSYGLSLTSNGDWRELHKEENENLS